MKGETMESNIAKSIKLQYHPVAIIHSDEKPENAISFKKGKWGCVLWMLSSAAKGKLCVFDRETYGCWGGGVGLGFGNQYHNFPGGIECFYYFLSEGNKNWEKGSVYAKKLEDAAGIEFAEKFRNGERYLKTHKHVEKFVNSMPIVDIPEKYVIFKPLKDVKDGEEPKSIVFICNPHQIAAMIVLANYYRDGNENVAAPFAAGCQQIGIFTYNEGEKENPRGILGLTDISGRKNVKNQLEDNMLTFSMPYKMFLEMEKNVEGSFINGETFKSLIS